MTFKRIWGLVLLLMLSACQPGIFASFIGPATPSPVAVPVTAQPTYTPATPPPTRVFTYPDTPTPDAKSTPTRLPTWTPYPLTPQVTSPVLGVFNFPADVDPLTGLKVKDKKILNRRPVMVKVSNFPSNARPQAGLSYADIVFEYYIGEFMNRFLAIFYGTDVPQAGPIRSGRYVDAQLVQMFGGFLVYGSADARVDEALVQILGKRAISHLEAPCPAICGEDTHTHTVFANTAEITKYARGEGISNAKPDLRGMIFDPRPPKGDDLAVNIAVQYVRFYRGEWHYNSQTQLYERWIDDDSLKVPPIMVPLEDRLNEQQLAFANVILIFATYVEYNPTLHDIEIWPNTTGKRAIFFRDGTMTEGTWRSVGNERPMQFFNRWGLPFALKPGNTWIVIVGDSSKFEQPAPGQWELRFDLP
jgi:hypothetical protein